MFSYRAMSPVYIHQIIVAIAVIAGIFYLREPLAIIGLLLLPSAPILPDEANNDDDDDLVSAKGSMGFIDTNEED
jgi:hypothetical protein